MRLWNSIRIIPSPARKGAARLLQAVSPAGIDVVSRMLRPFLPSRVRIFATGDKVHKFADFLSIVSREAIYLRALSHWNPSQVLFNSHEPATVHESISELAKVLNVRLAESIMLTDLLNYLPDDILTKVDRASMSVSLDAHV